MSIVQAAPVIVFPLKRPGLRVFLVSALASFCGRWLTANGHTDPLFPEPLCCR
jgi:hypothetical protein